MSYARLGPDSDVYVVRSTEGLECLACALDDPELDPTPDRIFSSSSSMVAHLRQHKAAGHKVPLQACIDLAIDELEAALA